MMIVKYKVEKLRGIVQEVLESDFDFYTHAHNKPKTLEEYEAWVREYESKDRVSMTYHDVLAIICEMINVDQDTVIAVEKSIRRHMEKTGWEHFISVDTRIAAESYRRAVSKA